MFIGGHSAVVKTTWKFLPRTCFATVTSTRDWVLGRLSFRGWRLARSVCCSILCCHLWIVNCCVLSVDLLFTRFKNGLQILNILFMFMFLLRSCYTVTNRSLLVIIFNTSWRNWYLFSTWGNYESIEFFEIRLRMNTCGTNTSSS